ncbi:MAG: serine/threonine-protein kinase [Kofleriaceae bacterium]
MAPRRAHHAHERHTKTGAPLNIVHRDVSPGNIMVGYDGSIKVLDFGIAKAEERATKTVGGTIKGKYGYMSPEQCKGKPLDRRSDIFALGIVLYELTTLRRAFKGADDFETMKRIVGGDLARPSAVVAGYPPALEAIVMTALAGEPEARFQTAQALIEALDAFAVREKLTGANTALARFMAQLFGARAEPWIDPARPAEAASDRTEISDPPAWPGEQRTAHGLGIEGATPGPPMRLPSVASLVDDVSEVGAQPLVDDPKLGWDTSVSNRRGDLLEAGGATRVTNDSTPAEASTGWSIFAILLVLAVAAAITAVVIGSTG